MPELPEVETIRRELEPLLVGRIIERVRIHVGAERLAINYTPRALELALTGRRIETLRRHGKYLLAGLNDGRTWVVHLRMSGEFIHTTNDASPHRFERARVEFDDGASLRLNDMRKFATWHLVADLSEAMRHTGPDALSTECSVTWLRASFARRSVAVKTALLDQRVIAGVGNIYADEACWLARIDPRVPARTLSDRQVARLHAAILRTLIVSLEHGGSAFDDWDGLSAANVDPTHISVFRRDGRPCERCGHDIIKVRVGGRGTHLCPYCCSPA